MINDGGRVLPQLASDVLFKLFMHVDVPVGVVDLVVVKLKRLKTKKSLSLSSPPLTIT